jgi:hypothetical protein
VNTKVRTMIAGLLLAAPAVAMAQVTAPQSPYPPCRPNKAASAACTCGVRPSTICPAGAWCSFTPEGAPMCSRRQPLHR